MPAKGTFGDWAERLEVMTAVASLISQYEWDTEKGLVTSPGRHENNTVQTLYFWEKAANREGETVGVYTILVPTAVEREIFGAMPGMFFFAVSEDDNGFVYGEWINAVRRKSLVDFYEAHKDGD